MFAAAPHIILYVNAGKEGQAGRQSYLAAAHDKSAGAEQGAKPLCATGDRSK